ncbi:MAG: ankyrin repeat domain-containing protein [Bacteroidota bacterium]
MPNRKSFLRNIVIGTSAIVLPKFSFTQTKARDRLVEAAVQDFVGQGHKDLDAVKKLHAQYPTLLNAAWDWGGGDFETALGAASHVGRIDIMNYLLEHGAQMNFLTLCVFGKTDLVKELLKQHPYLLNMKGPHGFTPLHHAIRGGENALEVKKLLEDLGAKETKVLLAYPG